MILVNVAPAGTGDWARLYAWRNSPEARAASENAKEIPLRDHMGWLAAALDDPDVIILVGTDQRSRKVGVVRFDLKKDAAWEVSVTVDPRERGNGMAAQLISHGISKMLSGQLAKLAGRVPRLFLARVREGNHASLRAFAASGFVPYAYRDGFALLERR